MKQEKQSLYENVISILRKPFFRTLANMFSHGATHTAFLVAVISIVAYLLYLNNHEVIVPHNLGINIDWKSYYKHNGGEAQKSKKDSIPNICINIRLNDEEISKETKGKYQNGITIDFDNVIIDRNQIVDTMQLSILSMPLLDSCSRDVVEDIGILMYKLDNKINPYTKEIRTDTTQVCDYDYLPRKYNLLKEDYFQNFPKTISDSIIGGYFIMPDKSKIDTAYAYRYRLNCFSDKIGINNDSPYYYYYISFPSTMKVQNKFEFIFSVSSSEEIGNSLKYTNKNLQFNYIFPTPDMMGNGRIEYNSEEKKKEIIKNQGVIIQAVDVDKLNEQNRNAFLISVLVGTGLAFALDIIIQLIRELRRLHRIEE